MKENGKSRSWNKIFDETVVFLKNISLGKIMIFIWEGQGRVKEGYRNQLIYIIYIWNKKRKEKNSEYRQNRSMLQQFHTSFQTTRNLQVDCNLSPFSFKGVLEAWEEGIFFYPT